ncbi:type II toxin-antitoxin system RelE/ParE family toxin [Thalassobius sp. I31.1]|uniref:type II toxin-antitoxin system RelE/ParE family toxin n=1 Tax=Thalassobius sp. I31.1 TaxID=2109912 RepID=UPI000D1A9DC3|nr:type II toxin-antitoxin system RelE/ParE family toxin [Thalassobius sp. I31.1]
MSANNLTGYQLTPAAQNDLEDIWYYTMQNWSATQADRYADILEDTLDRLVFMPEMARERLEFNPPVRIHPSAEHLIVYRIEGHNLAVLRILGASQNWQAILRAVDQ